MVWAEVISARAKPLVVAKIPPTRPAVTDELAKVRAALDDELWAAQQLAERSAFA
jgi:hypothetical protein